VQSHHNPSLSFVVSFILSPISPPHPFDMIYDIPLDIIYKDLYVLIYYQQATFSMCGTRYLGGNLKKFKSISLISAVRFATPTLSSISSNALLLAKGQSSHYSLPQQDR